MNSAPSISEARTFLEVCRAVGFTLRLDDAGGLRAGPREMVAGDDFAREMIAQHKEMLIQILGEESAVRT